GGLASSENPRPEVEGSAPSSTALHDHDPVALRGGGVTSLLGVRAGPTRTARRQESRARRSLAGGGFPGRPSPALMRGPTMRGARHERPAHDLPARAAEEDGP